MSEHQRIDIARPDTGEEEWQALREPLLSGWLTQGPRLPEFEEAFARRQGVEHAISTSSCSTAMHLALVSMGIGPGDEVIVPALTWVATANVVVHAGATPVFADVERATFNIDPREVERRVTDRTKAVVAVHLFGLCAEVERIREAAPGIPILEDAACAAGSELDGVPAGAMGECGAFSFHPRKVLTTGEGGMLTTSNADLAEKLRVFRNHGADLSEEMKLQGPRPGDLPIFDVCGFNFRMTELQAVIGLVQLGKLDRLVAERRQWAAWYSEELADIGWLRTPTSRPGSLPSYQAYVCYVDEETAPVSRDELLELLAEVNIHGRRGTHAVHMLGYYRDRFGYSPDDYPVARDCDRFTVALPLHNKMSPEDYRRVVDAVRSVG